MSGNFSMVDANNDGCVSMEEVAKNHLLVSECVFGQGSSHGSRSFDSAVTDGQWRRRQYVYFRAVRLRLPTLPLSA